jgi:hypothetical protein
MKTVQEIQYMAKKSKSKIDELSGQREHNASEGNWSIVKEIKSQIAMHQRALNILNEVLAEDGI